MYLNPTDPKMYLTITNTKSQQENEFNVTCRGITLFGLPTMEISIMNSYGYRSISDNKTYTIQQHSFHYDSKQEKTFTTVEQHATVYITGKTWINCTFEDDMGTYMKTEYMNIEGKQMNMHSIVDYDTYVIKYLV